MTYSYTSQSDNVGLIEPELIRVLVNQKWKIIKSSVTGKTNFLREALQTFKPVTMKRIDTKDE